ncbi:unnamed protein product [Calypogeia fissa]
MRAVHICSVKKQAKTLCWFSSRNGVGGFDLERIDEDIKPAAKSTSHEHIEQEHGHEHSHHEHEHNSQRWRYPTANDFGSEIIPASCGEFNVQAYLFNDYWEDIGTINSFFDANLALTAQPPKFKFYDATKPIFTSPRFLPPTKVEKCRVKDSIVSHGCFLRECSVEHSIVGVRSRIETGVVLRDTMMMGADMYETEAEMAGMLVCGKVPLGVGENSKIRNCIIDKNARIGRNVVITNADNVQDAERPSEGYYIRSGIVIILKNATIKDGTAELACSIDTSFFCKETLPSNLEFHF